MRHIIWQGAVQMEAIVPRQEGVLNSSSNQFTHATFYRLHLHTFQFRGSCSDFIERVSQIVAIEFKGNIFHRDD
jgi:hypothetical protein